MAERSALVAKSVPQIAAMVARCLSRYFVDSQGRAELSPTSRDMWPYARAVHTVIHDEVRVPSCFVTDDPFVLEFRRSFQNEFGLEIVSWREAERRHDHVFYHAPREEFEG